MNGSTRYLGLRANSRNQFFQKNVLLLGSIVGISVQNFPLTSIPLKNNCDVLNCEYENGNNPYGTSRCSELELGKNIVAYDGRGPPGAMVRDLARASNFVATGPALPSTTSGCGNCGSGSVCVWVVSGDSGALSGTPNIYKKILFQFLTKPHGNAS